MKVVFYKLTEMIELCDCDWKHDFALWWCKNLEHDVVINSIFQETVKSEELEWVRHNK